jgi:hypothetical protein
MSFLTLFERLGQLIGFPCCFSARIGCFAFLPTARSGAERSEEATRKKSDSVRFSISLYFYFTFYFRSPIWVDRRFGGVGSSAQRSGDLIYCEFDRVVSSIRAGNHEVKDRNADGMEVPLEFKLPLGL